MGCGSALGDLFILADTLVQSQASVSRLAAWSQGLGEQKPDAEGLRAQLYNMHGEGQISKEVFSALRDLADQGRLRPADLAVHRARAHHHRSQRKDREVTNALRGIRSRLNQLSEARSHSEKVLTDLQARIEELNAKEAGKAEAARQAVDEGDQAAARLRLTEKEELSASRERLTKQAQALRDDLARLDDLFSQLEDREAELEAVLARGELASLNSSEGP